MSATPDPALLEEAAGWLVRFQSETLSVADRAAFERWRDRSAAHAAAWRRVEDMLRSFGQVPPALGAHTLRRLERPARRQVLRTVTGLLLAGPAAWLAWRGCPGANGAPTPARPSASGGRCCSPTARACG